MALNIVFLINGIVLLEGTREIENQGVTRENLVGMAKLRRTGNQLRFFLLPPARSFCPQHRWDTTFGPPVNYQVFHRNNPLGIWTLESSTGSDTLYYRFGYHHTGLHGRVIHYFMRSSTIICKERIAFIKSWKFTIPYRIYIVHCNYIF